MSKRKNDDKALEELGNVAGSFISSKSISTGTKLLVGGVLAALVVLVIGGYLIWNSLQQTPTTQPAPGDDEQQAGQVAREDITPVPGAPNTNLGSGGSANSDWYELHFTAPKYPDKKEYHQGGLDTYLVNLMNKAQKTLDVADYDFDLQDVTDAMVAAKDRGVRVRMVTDSDTINNTKNAPVQAAFAKLKKAGIPYIGDERGPIMHNKFTVVDNEWVETGSWNYTDGDTYHLNNNMIIIHNAKLAANYTTEFEKMFVKKQFGPNKDKGVPNPVIDINGTKVQNYFAAEDGVADKIVQTIKGANKSIYFLAFSFTHEGIGNAIIDKAKAGVKVGGVFETTGSNTPYSEYGKMKQAGLDVYTDGNPYVMHHKVIIVDERTVIFGSFNFSDNADKSNDENLLIVDDPNMAKAFKDEYDRVLNVAKNPPVKKK
ncbi:MAG TPA: phospholipase D-like domain-containing protein [Chloroflexia bacterium]|nr:phospholipase D-like domain-containing protein [Chloroflexia bacterium]